MAATKAAQKISFTQEDLQVLIATTTAAAVKAAVSEVNKGNRQVISETVTQTEESRKIGLNLSARQGDRTRSGHTFFQKLAKEKHKFKKVKIDKIYKAYFGPALTVTINGSTIKVPVDGKFHLVHEAFWRVIEEKKMFTSNRIAKNSRYNEMLGQDAKGDFAYANVTTNSK